MHAKGTINTTFATAAENKKFLDSKIQLLLHMHVCFIQNMSFLNTNTRTHSAEVFGGNTLMIQPLI